MSLEKLQFIAPHSIIKLEDDEYQNVPAVESFEKANLISSTGSKKCGEIYLKDHTNFSLICAICGVAYFDLTAFGTHYLQEHVNKTTAHSDNTLEYVHIKAEVKSEEDIADFEESSEFIYTDEGKESIKEEETMEDIAEHLVDESLDFDDGRLIQISNVRDRSNASQRGLICGSIRESIDRNPKADTNKTLESNRIKTEVESEDATNITEFKIEESFTIIDLTEESIKDEVTESLNFLYDCQNETTVLPREEKDRDYQNILSKVATDITDPDLYCELCDHQFINVIVFRNHALHKHSKPPEALKRLSDYLQCIYCLRKLTDISKWRNHEKSHKNEKRPYSCPHCLKRFAERTKFRDHINIHTGERPYKCDMCPSTFADYAIRNRHKAIHAKSKHYKTVSKSATKKVEPLQDRAFVIDDPMAVPLVRSVTYVPNSLIG